jgi:hypothetical protein
MEYLKANQNTVEWYDGIAGSVSTIGSREICAAGIIKAQWDRNPVGANAAMTREEWFDTKNRDAPWTPLTDAKFESADPRVVGGTYDQLIDVWYSFAGDDRFQRDASGKVLRNARGKMSYAGFVQINKILYLVRPTLFPIFDGVLSRGYAHLQTETMREVLIQRGRENLHNDHFIWEPFRSDLLHNKRTEVFESVRQELTVHRTQLIAVTESPLGIQGITSVNEWVRDNVSDLRLMDILAWWCFKHHRTSPK